MTHANHLLKLAVRIGLSESAVRRRIKNLTDSGIIKRFTIEMNHAATRQAQ